MIKSGVAYNKFSNSHKTIKTFGLSQPKIRSIQSTPGKGDTVPGSTNVPGNTSNPVGNAQRDGQPREYRNGTGVKRNSKSMLESRKRNKSS